MADYDSTVGVKLQDDFSSLLSGLKEVQSAISSLKIQMNGLYEVSSKLKTVLSGLNNSSFNNSISKAQSTMSSTIVSAQNKLKSQSSVFSSLMSKYKTSTASSESSGVSSLVGLNDINGTKLRQIIAYQQNISGLGKSLDEVGVKSEKNSSKFWRFFDLNRLYFYSNYFKQIFRGIGNIIQSSLDFTETENYFARAMGNMYDEAMKFQNKLSDMFGTAISTTMNAQAVYKNMIGSLGGISDDLSYQLSETVTKMTLDFSSLYNVDFEDASKKFQSALSKQVRPIRSTSGYDITQNVLGQTAENIGMTKTLSDATELEKRLLVIITLMQQMARSGAMNDFSRTIEQPANQLRVLKEQLSEVGRWLGSVFYGILGQILPYINGFVMAIKEVVKWFALLVGYEIPDSSGDTGTILDGYGDEWNDLNDSISDTSDGIDDANDKAKEFQKTLGKTDELNIIKKPTDTSSSGSSGSGGSSLGSIDPAILSALDKYKYLFDDIRMKAMDIRDSILAWGNVAKEAINDNIFEPLQKSWDKYGASITKNFESGFGKLKILAIDFLDTWSSNWKPNFQVTSNLFFSLLDTAGLVFDTISDFMLSVWVKGGKDLYNSINELSRAFIKLATSINDNFVKPFVKWFKNTISPLLSDVLGTFFKLLGNIISVLAKFVSAIAESKTAVVLLTSVATSFFAVMKVAKFTELVSSVGKLNSAMGITSSVFSNVFTVLYDHNKIFQKLTNSWIDGGVKINSFKSAYSALNSLLANTKVWEKVFNCLTSVSDKMIDFGTNATNSGNILGKAVTGMGTALSWLASNPVVAVVAGLAAITAGIIIFSSTHKTETDKVREDLDKLNKKIDDSGEKIKNLGDKTKESLSSSSNDYLLQTKYLEDLVELTGGQNGYVSNIDQARMLAEKLNEVSEDSVSITEDGYLTWKKIPEEISKTIDMQKELLNLQVYEEQYVEALKQEKEVKQNLADATKVQTEAQKEFNDKMTELQEKYPEHTYESLIGLAWDYKVNLDDANASLVETTFQQAQNQFQMQSLDLQYQAMNGTLSESAIAQATLNLTMSNAMGINGELTATYASLGGSLQEYDQKLLDHANGVATMTQEEITQTTIAKDYVLQSLVEKAAAHDQSYDTMLSKVQEYGITLSEEEKSQLKTSYDNYTSGNATQESIQETHYQQLKTLFAKQGIEMSDEQLRQIATEYSNQNSANEKIRVTEAQQNQKLLSMLKSHNVDINSEEGKEYTKKLSDAQKNGLSAGEEYLKETAKGFKKKKKDVTDEADEIGKESKKAIESDKNKAEIKVDTKAAETKINNLADKAGFTKTATVNLNIKSNKNGIKIGNSTLDFSFYASGGIPSVGEIFMARENGINEMVGRMGSRSAVANNDQIVDGIESGVFNAVVRALQMSGSTNGSQPSYIENIFKIGEEVIEKQMVKANERKILRTGKPLFSKQ